jgi:hypothetical protein
MRKKIVKMIESVLPRLYDEDGNPISKKNLANQILDSIPHPERLDLLPFEKFIPFACSTCKYNDAYRLGCTYELFGQKDNKESPPKDCPLGFV